MVASRGGYRMARGRHYAKLSLSNAARLSFSDLCILLFMFLSLCRLCVCVFLCSHWSLVDVPLIFFCPADHVPDWQPRGSTIGEGGDTTILSPGRSPKQPLPGMRLHDPLHGQQAYPELIAFDQGVGRICPRWGLLSCRFLPKRGQICYIPPPPPIVELVTTCIIGYG